MSKDVGSSWVIYVYRVDVTQNAMKKGQHPKPQFRANKYKQYSTGRLDLSYKVVWA